MSSKILSFLYPRLYGGYAFLKYGNVGRAIQDLTGAVVQSVPPSAPLLGGAVPRSTLLLAISAHVSTINFKSKIHVKANQLLSIHCRTKVQNDDVQVVFYRNILTASQDLLEFEQQLLPNLRKVVMAVQMIQI